MRYTFEYREARYTQGVWADIGRLKEEGFELQIYGMRGRRISTKESTASGSSQRPASGSKVQFHTRISFEAKQLTHPAYERLRDRQPDKFEQMVLEAFQKKVSAEVPVPPGALQRFPTTGRGVKCRSGYVLRRCGRLEQPREAGRGFSAYLHRGCGRFRRVFTPRSHLGIHSRTDIC